MSNEYYSPLAPPDYDTIEQKKWQQSQKKVIEEAHNPTDRLIKRISTFTSRFGYSEADVLTKIQHDEMFAAHFAKEPRRTGLHEDIAAEWIKALPGVHDFEVLPKSGNRSIKVSSDGNILQSSMFPNVPGKSLDFKWITGDKTFYAMHKYTKEGGGNQDSQYQEMIELMKRFVHCRDETIVLVVIVDGQYYQKNNAKKLTELQRCQKNTASESHAVPIGDLPGILEKYE